MIYIYIEHVYNIAMTVIEAFIDCTLQLFNIDHCILYCRFVTHLKLKTLLDV